MKTKELIELLQKQNPDSVVEVKDFNGHLAEATEVFGNPASCVVAVEITSD